ncbi:hypothetical protein JTE90_000433 [Oedothorax gibbosus]|uniref:BTB domain-containing protein n=1 Tax=Oedothorax gibbosus TaxID=931172 RepID=A0AAV6UFG1_9ARAC|nr:hypothetical protein JTE90_000433 [Oedothorax gibbosus]
MAAIGRLLRNIFGRVRAFIASDSNKDSIPFTVDGDPNIELVGFRYLSGSLTEIDHEDGNSLEISSNDKLHSCPTNDESSEEKANVQDAEQSEDPQITTVPDNETEQGGEAQESMGNNIKVEIFHANLDWTIVDDMQDNIFPRPAKKPSICDNNVSTTPKRQTVAEVLLKNGCQLSPKSPHIESFQLLRHVSKGRFVKVKPNVLLEVGEDYKFQVHKEKFLLHARHFKECLIDGQRTLESFWALKVDPKYVDIRALYCIFHFLYENRPLTCRHFAQVITTANYLGMDRMICYLQMIVKNRIPIHINSMLQNSLCKFVLAFEMRSQLEKSQVIATHDSGNVHVTVKGQKGDLNEEDLSRLCNQKYIKLQSERSMLSLTELGGNVFEKVAVGPHIVFDAAESLTYWVFNVFKSNVEEALFIDAEIWKDGLETSLEQSVEYLSLHYQELVLSNAYSQLNEAQFEYIPRQDIVEDLKDIQPHMKVPEWKKMRYWTKNLKLESESDSE